QPFRDRADPVVRGGDFFRLVMRYTRREENQAILGAGRSPELPGDRGGELQRGEGAGAVDEAQADVAEELVQAVGPVLREQRVVVRPQHRGGRGGPVPWGRGLPRKRGAL